MVHVMYQCLAGLPWARPRVPAGPWGVSGKTFGGPMCWTRGSVRAMHKLTWTQCRDLGGGHMCAGRGCVYEVTPEYPFE